MPEQSRMHFYLNWAKERLDEMDATLALLEDRAAKMQADSRANADRFIADLRKRRDEFRTAAKNQAEASDAAWDSIKVQLETEWQKFEGDVKKYLETFGKDIEQQKAVFRGQVAAQIKAWRDTADMIHAAAMQFAVERRRDIDATVSRMRADATAADEKLQKLADAGAQSWSAFNAALGETRAAFDRANQAARDAFKRATSSAQ
jgi:hypothetical protein